MKRKKLIIILIPATLFLAFIFFMAFRTKTQVKELFKLNKELQEEGYYMAEFEFRMLGFAYTLDKGKYFKALAMLSDYHKQLQNRTTLVKMPDFKSNQDEINFYINLQNPKTGAFMDDNAPFCTYWSVTENVLDHLDALTDTTTTPLSLKFPLKFLDEINSPEKLKLYLNNISYVGNIAPKFPQTSFHFARDLLSISSPDNVLEKTNLYQFSPEWKQTMLQWMYEFQDTTTGMWGPKNRRTKKLASKDLNNTSSVIKVFRDENGNDIHKEFHLKYVDRLFASTLAYLAQPFPDDDDLAEIHTWNLEHVKGMNMLLRYLWKDASAENRKKAELIINNLVTIFFENYYIEKEGAFSYYPNAQKASVDGMTNMILDDLGALSYEKQKKLWGDPKMNAKDFGTIVANELINTGFDSIFNMPGINSIRIYTNTPDFENLTTNVWAVIYPKKTPVLDILELVPNIVNWTENSSLSMGNWKSMAEVKNKYTALNIKKPLIFHAPLAIDEINRKLKETHEIYLVGFNILQIPKLIIHYKHL